RDESASAVSPGEEAIESEDVFRVKETAEALLREGRELQMALRLYERVLYLTSDEYRHQAAIGSDLDSALQAADFDIERNGEGV
ncbi:unnamed protein product, partial [Amoebophrya sp. A25]